MIRYRVDDMSCNHCVAAITRAVREADAQAEVRIDLAGKRVEIDPRAADEAALRRAIKAAGYTPQAAA